MEPIRKELKKNRFKMIKVIQRYDNPFCEYTNYVDEEGEWLHLFFKDPNHPVYRISGAEQNEKD